MNLSDCMAVPEVTFECHREMLFASWQALERQQERITDPGIYKKLDWINQILFSVWMHHIREVTTFHVNTCLSPVDSRDDLSTARFNPIQTKRPVFAIIERAGVF
jgi:hypothetical protein